MSADSSRAIVAALGANLGIAAAKIVGFVFTGAASLLAEAIHSIADSSNQGLLILGRRLAQRRETEQHAFGYGRERYFWSFIVALIIFSLGALFALYEGVSKLFDPHPIESPAWAIGILGVAVLLEGVSFATAWAEAKKIRGGSSLLAFIRHSKVPEIPVVLLEDMGALLGLLFALAGVGLAVLTGDPRFDALGSVVIGVLLFVIALILAMRMRSLLLGESASTEAVAEISACIRDHSKVQRLIHLRTQHLGPEEILLGVKVQLDQHLDFAGVVAAINDLEKSLRQRCPSARVIYIEPDIFRADHHAEDD